MMLFVAKSDNPKTNSSFETMRKFLAQTYIDAGRSCR